MKKIYSIEDDWVDTEDFLKQIAVKKGRLLKVKIFKFILKRQINS